jgi:hypothetical protein
MLLDSDAPYTMHEKMLPTKFPTACNYNQALEKWLILMVFIYMRQELLVGVNFVVLALGQDERHRHGNCVSHNGRDKTV